MKKLSETVVKSLKRAGTLAGKALEKIEAFGSGLVDKIPVATQDKITQYRGPIYIALAGIAFTSMFVAPALTGKLIFAALSFGLVSDTCANKTKARAREAAAREAQETETVVTTAVDGPSFKPNAAAPDFKNAVNAEQPIAANNNDTINAKPVNGKAPANKAL